MPEGRVLESRTPPLPRRSLQAGHPGHRRCRSEASVLEDTKVGEAGEDANAGRPVGLDVGGTVEEAIDDGPENLVIVGVEEATPSYLPASEPLERVGRGLTDSDGDTVDVDDDPDLHSVQMVSPVDSVYVFDDDEVADENLEPELEAIMEASTPSPTSHSPLLPLSAGRSPRSALEEQQCLGQRRLCLVLEDRCHHPALDPAEAPSKPCPTVNRSRGRTCKDHTLAMQIAATGISYGLKVTGEEGIKKRRGRRGSKTSWDKEKRKRAWKRRLPHSVEKTELNVDYCTSEGSNSSDKENDKSKKNLTPNFKKGKRGRPCKLKPSTMPDSFIERDKGPSKSKMMLAAVEGQTKDRRRKCNLEPGGKIRGRPKLEAFPSCAKSLRRRPPVDWSVLRKKELRGKEEGQVNHLDKVLFVDTSLEQHPNNKRSVLSPTEDELGTKKKRLKKEPKPGNGKLQCTHKAQPAPPAPSLSPTFVDSDLARPSRNVVRPVRLGDQLEAAQENLAIMRLPQHGTTPLPYDADSLVWNAEHTVNDQGSYCYCGGAGDWYNRMVSCARCSQWFHERCLAPRPLAMPLVPGDPFWLFVCAHCNSGSECLKRMELTWANLVHLSLFDLTLKTERKFHHFENDLMPFLLSSWSNFQLRKHFNQFTEEDKRLKVKEELLSHCSFENGHEVGQDEHLWGLRLLAPPLRPVYQVPDVGIIQERTVLDEVVILKQQECEHKNLCVMMNLNIEYKNYRSKTNKPVETVEKPRKAASLKEVPSSSQVISKNGSLKGRKKPTARTEVATNSPENLKFLVDVNITCAKPEEDHLKLKQHSDQNCQPSQVKSHDKPKPLPYEISKILHKRGYPKVAMKYASVIPPKKCIVLKSLDTKDAKTNKKESKKKKELCLQNGERLETDAHTLDLLIPVKNNYSGAHNPFRLGSSEVQRAARNLLCNRKLNEEDLTNVRSKIKKRKYKLCIEQSRKLWKTWEDDQVNDIYASQAPTQVAGRVVNQHGEIKLIMVCKNQTETLPDSPTSAI